MFIIDIQHEYIDNDNEESRYIVKFEGPELDHFRTFDTMEHATQFVKECLVCYLIDSGKY